MCKIGSPDLEKRGRHVTRIREGVIKMIGYEIDGSEHWILTEGDFYPPADDRRYGSGIDDALNGEGYYDYAKAFWGCFGDDLYDDRLSYRFNVVETDKVICRGR